jgi:hypothetical protein
LSSAAAVKVPEVESPKVEAVFVVVLLRERFVIFGGIFSNNVFI